MVVEKYNPKWVEQFRVLKEFLGKNTTEYISIEHVGSTSIPGMNAKPIIDIDIVVEDASQFQRLKEELSKIGYVHEGDRGILGREAFDHENVPLNIDHHLYVCVRDNDELLRHLKFRDKLRSSPELVNEYNKIKEEILVKVGADNRAGYVQMKEKEYKWFFEKVLS
ncbi:MAG: GrpB family protein [Spirochaetaceae bacterium]|nr:GrpB family protein [Spirochaetaceae bacterium]